MAKWKPGKPGRPPKGVKYTPKKKTISKKKGKVGRPKGSTNKTKSVSGISGKYIFTGTIRKA